MKKFFSVLLAFCLILSAVPASAKNLNYATEYRNILSALSETYGVSEVPEMLAGSSDLYDDPKDGIVAADLINLDWNGAPELYVVIKRTDSYGSPAYLHLLYTYSCGWTRLIDSENGLTDFSLWDYKFYTVGTKTYLYKEYMDSTFSVEPDEFQSSFDDSLLCEFNGFSFQPVLALLWAHANAPTPEELAENGISQDSGYLITKNSDYGYYDADLITMADPDGIHDISPQGISLANEMFYDALTGIIGKDNFYIDENDFVHDNARSYVCYTTGGPLLSATCPFNYAETYNHLTALNKALGDDTIHVTVNASELSFDQPPIILNSRTLVPVRAIFEALGATVLWDAVSDTATAVKGSTTLSITIDQPVLYKNGTPIPLDVPAMIVNDRTLIPLRAISEALDCTVNWVDETRTAEITE